MYRAVIFDVDGTLVDSNDAHAHAWVKAIAETGREVEFARVRRLIGKGGDKLLPDVTGLSIESPEGKAIAKRRREIFNREYLPRLKPTRGARQLVERLHRDGMTLVVASSAEKDELDDLLNVPGVKDFFKAKTSSDDAERSKPDPDIVTAALKQAGSTAAETIMVGDTPYDVEAAKRAGIDIIALRSGGWADGDLRGAIAIYDDPAQLLERYDDSPFKRLPAARSV